MGQQALNLGAVRLKFNCILEEVKNHCCASAVLSLIESINFFIFFFLSCFMFKEQCKEIKVPIQLFGGGQKSGTATKLMSTAVLPLHDM